MNSITSVYCQFVENKPILLWFRNKHTTPQCVDIKNPLAQWYFPCTLSQKCAYAIKKQCCSAEMRQNQHCSDRCKSPVSFLTT